MIAVAENSGRTVLIYRTFSAYENGRKPIVWDSAEITDDTITSLGYKRVGDWQRVEPGLSYATIKKA